MYDSLREGVEISPFNVSSKTNYASLPWFVTLLETPASLHARLLHSKRVVCTYSYQRTAVLLAVTQTQRRASWKPLSSKAQKDTVSSCIFHWLLFTAAKKSEPFKLFFFKLSNCISMLLICFAAVIVLTCNIFFFLWRKCFVLVSAKTCWLNQDDRVFSIKCSSAKEVHCFFSQNQN